MLADYSKVDTRLSRYGSVNFEVKNCFVLLALGYSGKRKDLVTLEKHVPSIAEMRLFSKVRRRISWL